MSLAVATPEATMSHYADLAAYLASPRDRPFAGAQLAAQDLDDSVRLVAVRGALTADSAEHLVTLAGMPWMDRDPAATVVDLRDYADSSVGQYELLFGFVSLQRTRRARGHRTYLVVSGHPGAAAALGYAAFGEDDFCTAALLSGAEALRLAGALEPARRWAEWEALLGATREPPFLVRLRAYLRGHLHDATVESSASALGMSSRALQRALQGRESSFRRVLTEERIERARAALAAGETKLLAVAIESGFSRVESMNEAFERVLGSAPRDHATRAHGR